jgi:AcrR family transcriptional regulator
LKKVLEKNERSFYYRAMTAIQTKGASTRDNIVAAALELAKAAGLDALTIGRVADAVSMSKSGVFAHFGSREDLQLAVLEAATTIFGDAVFRPALKLKRGLPRLRAVLENSIVFYQDLSHGCVILSASHEFDDKPGAVRDAVLAYLRRLRGELERAIRYAVDAAELPAETDVAQLAFECFGIFLVVHHDLKTMRDPAAAQRGTRAIEQLLQRQR